MTGPRAHRDPRVVAEKLRRLSDPHMAPLTQYVERLREQRGGGEAVPWFDPGEAGVRARIIVLLEAPGARATGAGGPRPASRGSSIVSPDNNDTTAANMWSLLHAAEIKRDELVVTWNVVPWYVGDGERIRAVTTSDIIEARPALLELLGLLPDLRVALLLGRKAQRAWQHVETALPAIEVPHPSPLSLNREPTRRPAIREALIRAREIATR